MDTQGTQPDALAFATFAEIYNALDHPLDEQQQVAALQALREKGEYYLLQASYAIASADAAVVSWRFLIAVSWINLSLAGVAEIISAGAATPVAAPAGGIALATLTGARIQLVGVRTLQNQAREAKAFLEEVLAGEG